MLSPTATRMLDTLPVYYRDNPIVLRILQARANEIDRIDAMIDAVKQGMIPAASDDTLGLLALWEFILGLPIRPPSATVEQRQATITAGVKRLTAATAADVLGLLASQLGVAFSINRDDPVALEDTITLHMVEGIYTSEILLRTLRKVWPAHRLLNVRYDAGFALDVSHLDEDAL